MTGTAGLDARQARHPHDRHLRAVHRVHRASGVTTIALGGVLMPALVRQGYPERFSMGLIADTGSVGLLFPPALPLFIYGTVFGRGVRQPVTLRPCPQRPLCHQVPHAAAAVFLYSPGQADNIRLNIRGED
jgi:hypothetical protein